MTPRPQRVDEKERALDRLIVAARQVLRLGVVVTVVFLAGCITPGHVSTDIWHRLTPDQQAEAHTIEGVLAKFHDTCRTESATDSCVPPRVLVTWSGTIPKYRRAEHTILVPAQSLDPRLRAIMAHEMAHAWFADARDTCQTEAKLFVCEQNANLHGAQVLRDGYGYPEPEAVRMMWVYLVAAVRAGVKPSHGHPDACNELHAFERRVGVTSLYACEEKPGVTR